MLALPRTSLAAKCQSQLLQRGRQAECSLSGWGEQAGQGFGEGFRGAVRLEAAPPPHMQHEADSGANDGKITGVARIVAMDVGRFSATARAARRHWSGTSGQSDKAGLCVQINDDQTGKENSERMIRLHEMVTRFCLRKPVVYQAEPCGDPEHGS